MTKALNDLDPRCKAIMLEFLARLVEAQIPVVIVNVLRTASEQAINVANGVSWTLNSKHLPQSGSGKSLAMDICPYAQYQLHGSNKLQWDSSDPIWSKIGTIAESLGLVWGGHWKQRDMGHVEFKC